jgi:hypothetical protein
VAQLTVPITDLALDPAANVEVFAYLSDVKGHHLNEQGPGGLLIGPQRQITDSLGVATFDLVPNEDVQRQGTYYAIDVAGSVAPIIIRKGPGSETLSQATAFVPEDLEPGVGLDALWDVDLTGLDLTKPALRWSGGMWVPWAWPTGSGSSTWVTLITGTTFLASDSSFRYRADAAAAPFTITLPTALGHMGIDFLIKRVNVNANNVTIAAAGGQTIDGAPTFVLNEPWQAVTFSSDNANWMVM